MEFEVCIYTEEEYEAYIEKQPALIINTDWENIKTILSQNNDVIDFIEDNDIIHARMNIRNIKIYVVFKLKAG